MSETREEQWQDADRDIWRHEEWEGKRVTVRANADYLNALEQERDELRAKAVLADEIARACSSPWDTDQTEGHASIYWSGFWEWLKRWHATNDSLIQEGK